ncbi:MAG TPA: O-acetyl-ADP-ribose deacetylase [Actinobacteria bacterium]|nr:O-acetyl-ADP-ribose deacetylase [Actinomycetota bacterium]
MAVVAGDITKQTVDAIVNAANEHLAHGGGVAAAIARAGGAVIQEESDAWVARHGPLSPGVAAVTSAGAMPATWVVHVAGPIHHPGQDNAGLLATAVRAALDSASHLGARSVALPAISAGIYGYPVAEATAVIATTVREWCASRPDAFDEVRLVGYGADVVAGFEATLPADR